MTDIGAMLERDYGVHISCSRGTLEENIERAAGLPRFLMVYLHNPNHFDTDKFVEVVLASDRMVGLLNERAVLYGADVTTSHGAQLASQLQCTTYPFVAAFFKKQIICRLQGAELLKPDFTFAQLERALDVWDHDLSKEIAIRMDRERNEVERIVEETAESERMQRDRALLEAFEQREAQKKRDAEAAEEAARTLKRQREEEALALAKQKEEAVAEARRIEEALQLAKSLALSRVTGPPPADTDPSLVLCVNIRFPKRAVERRFLLSESVEALYSFVETTEEFSGMPFKLMLSGMPPKLIARSDHQTLGDAVGGQLRVAIMFREG
jgi:FAS-associated factor 2